MSGVTLEAYLLDLRTTVDDALARVLASTPAPPVVGQAIHYALTGPGKRLRPCLTLAAADAVAESQRADGQQARAMALPGACAVEMVHTYSLVHDDLPAMDNDAMRRGRPTTHIVHGEGMAILAGDGLLTDAFAVLAASPSPATGPGAPVSPADRRLRAVAVLAAAAGSIGMVGGQAIDLAAVGLAHSADAPIDARALEDMHARKTGALIRAASAIGAILSGGSDAATTAIDRYAADLGLAFQIVDDVLDVEGSSTALGKTAGKDAASGKPTFPALYGLEQSKRLAADCIDRAHATLESAGLKGRLGELATWTLRRTH